MKIRRSRVSKTVTRKEQGRTVSHNSDDASLIIPSADQWDDLNRDVELNGPYMVIEYDDDVHSRKDVIVQLQRATGCTFNRAHAVSWEIDLRGRAIVYSGNRIDCERVAKVLRRGRNANWSGCRRA